MKKIIGAVIVIALVVIAVWNIVNKEQSKPSTVTTNVNSEEGLAVGKKAPDFILKNLEGEEITLSELRGKKNVMLNFWATWCPPCKAEMPEMANFYEKYKQHDFEILAINLATTEKGTKNIRAFVEARNIDFPILLDTFDEVNKAYIVGTIPTSYFINKEGKIVQKYIGPVDEEKLMLAKKMMENNLNN